MPCRAPRIESTTNRLGVPNSSDAVLRVEGHDGRHRKEFACCVAMLPPLTFLVLLRPSSGKMVVLSDSFFLKAIVFRLTSLPVWPTRSIAQRTSTRYRCRLSLITGPSLNKNIEKDTIARNARQRFASISLHAIPRTSLAASTALMNRFFCGLHLVGQ